MVTTDNCLGQYIDANKDAGWLEDMRPIAGVPIKDLVCENPGLLIFPDDLDSQGDDIGQSSIFTIQEYKQCSLGTGNIMGFIGVNKSQLTIRSRFSNSEGGDFFLYYMINRVFCPNIVDFPHSSNNDTSLDIMMLLFPYYLLRALQQGLYKEYRRNEYNNANVKGRIDVNRHLKVNMPFVGNVAYSVREHCYDNNVTQLIRHTIEFMKASEFGRMILSRNEEVKNGVNVIISHTSTYSKMNLTKIVSANSVAVTHPYYQAYKPLQSLCLMILRKQHQKMGESKNKIFGILFDGAWLWEEYLAKVLKSEGYKHPKNKSGENHGIYLFSTNRGYPRYPDFYGNGIVLDAKYKRINQQIDRNDMHQMISYMYILKVICGVFLSPTETDMFHRNIGKLNGYQGEVHCLSLKIPQNFLSYKAFANQMNISEQSFGIELRNILNELAHQS